MAFARKNLKAMGLEEETIDAIIEMHRETLDPLKEERDKYKADAEKLADTRKELEDLKKLVNGEDSYKAKFEKEHKDFEDYKKGVEEEKTKASKLSAYKDLLKKAKVSDDWIDDIVKFTTTDDIELDESGAIKDADKRVEDIKAKYAKYIVTETQRGANTENPPTNVGGNKMSKAEIFKKDEHGRYVLPYSERIAAIEKNLQ